MNDRARPSPAMASPGYDEFVIRYGLAMLKEPGGLQIVGGDLALTKDLDLMLGDKSYNALFRLAEHWRHNSAHVAFLTDLLDLMAARHREAADRLEEASENEAERKHKTGDFFSRSREFMTAWHNHFDEEGTAIFGQITYAAASSCWPATP